MQQPNQAGVYAAEIIEEVARRGRSYASIRISQCDDGLYRHSVEVYCTDRGFGGPITLHTAGQPTADMARTEGLKELIARFPKGHPHDGAGVLAEFREMRAQIEEHFRQPSLF